MVGLLWPSTDEKYPPQTTCNEPLFVSRVFCYRLYPASSELLCWSWRLDKESHSRVISAVGIQPPQAGRLVPAIRNVSNITEALKSRFRERLGKRMERRLGLRLTG